MTIKEKPLIDAASRMGPLPGFLFSNPFLAGFFSALMCAVFGATAMLFLGLGHGADRIELFEAMRIGAAFGLILNVIVLAGAAISAFSNPEERSARLLFVFGGVLGIASVIAADHYAVEHVRAWMIETGPISGWIYVDSA